MASCEVDAVRTRSLSMAVSTTPTQTTWDTVTYGHVGGVPGTSTSLSLQSPNYSGTEAYVMFVNENVTATCPNWINWYDALPN